MGSRPVGLMIGAGLATPPKVRPQVLFAINAERRVTPSPASEHAPYLIGAAIQFLLKSKIAP